MQARELVGKSVALVSLEIAGKLLPLVTFPIVARALGPDMYGKVGFAGSLVAFFGLLAAPGFGTYATREAARNPQGIRRIVSHMMGARLLFSLGSYALLVLYTFTLAPSDPVIRNLILLSGLSMLISSIDVGWVFSSQSRVWILSVVGIVGQLLTAAFTIFFIREVSDAGLLVLISAISPAVAGLYLLFRARHEYRITLPELSPTAWKGMLPVCFTLGLSSVMSLVYDQIDMIMLQYLRPGAEVGMYAASYRIMGLALTSIFFVGQLFFPLIYRTAKSDAEQEKQYLQWMAVTMLVISLPVAALGITLAEPLSLLILGPAFAGADELVRWLMLNVIATATAIFFGGRLVPHDREKQYLLAVLTGALVNIGLNALMIPSHGAEAAVWATVFSQFSVAGIALYFGRDLPMPSISRKAGFPFFSTGAMVVGVELARKAFDPHVIVLLIAGAAVYCAVYFPTRKLWERMPRFLAFD